MGFKSLPGRLFITSLRMVFMPSNQAKAGCQSIEVPFRGLWEERFHQPIFNVNNLTATVQYYDDQPFQGDLTIKLEFREGGVNTFLPVFNNVLGATRRQLAAEAQQADASGGGSSPFPSAGAMPSGGAAEYMPGNNDAFVDPHDPSKLYTTQPISDTRREGVPSWSASSGGLRKRH